MYEGWRFTSFEAGQAALRRLAQDGPLPTVLRLSDETETMIGLARPDAIGGGLEANAGCLAITGYEGATAEVTGRRRARPRRTARRGRGVPRAGAGRQLGARPVLRALPARLPARRRRLRGDPGDRGLLVGRCPPCTSAVRTAVTTTLFGAGTPPLVMCHVSHVYPTGASLYFTVVSAQGEDPVGPLDTGQAGRQRRDPRGGRDDQPPPRRRHRPPRLVRPGDRPAGRRGPARGQGPARPGRHPQPRRPDPAGLTGITRPPGAYSCESSPPSSIPPRADRRAPPPSCRSPACCARPAPTSSVVYSHGLDHARRLGREAALHGRRRARRRRRRHGRLCRGRAGRYRVAPGDRASRPRERLRPRAGHPLDRPRAGRTPAARRAEEGRRDRGRVRRARPGGGTGQRLRGS